MPEHADPDLFHDKVVLVTGATDGLGREVALELARRGAHLIVHGRSDERLASLIGEVRAAEPEVTVRSVKADFASLDQVRAMVASVLDSSARLDVLINNAGLGFQTERRVSVDGHELVFQVNYLAGWLLSHGLRPLLERSRPSAIVNVASAGQSPIDFDDPMQERSWDGNHTYWRSKLAQIMMTIDLAKALEPDGIGVNALHPSTYMPTKMVIGRNDARSTVEQGVQAVVELARKTLKGEITGAYYNVERLAEPHAQALDPRAREQLQALSQRVAPV